MTDKEIIEKYKLDKNYHSVWDNMVDNWMSVEIYRIIFDKLPNEKGAKKISSKKLAIMFLDKMDKNPSKIMSSYENWGSLFLTAKRMLYKSLKL